MKTGDKVLVEGIVDFEPVRDEDEEELVRIGFESPHKHPHGMMYVLVPVRLVKPKLEES
jgi:hypothetical protein